MPAIAMTAITINNVCKLCARTCFSSPQSSGASKWTFSGDSSWSISSCEIGTPAAVPFFVWAAIRRLIKVPKAATPIVCPIDLTNEFSAVEAPRRLYPTEDWAMMVNTVNEKPNPIPYNALKINNGQIGIPSVIMANPAAPKAMIIMPISEV
ncbi:hypothetical protein D3C74_233790 [compost metagenome]